MPTISQLPLAANLVPTDLLPVSQGGVTRGASVQSLLSGTQAQLTLPTNALLGRVSNGAGPPEPVALGSGLSLQGAVLAVDHSGFPQTGTLTTTDQVILNTASGAASLMPLSLLRGLYKPGSNVSIAADGTISSTPQAASGSSLGAVSVGNGLVINASGALSVNIGTVSGTVAAGDDPRLVNAEQITNKGAPSGYASLDSTGKVPPAQLPPGGNSPVQSVAGRTGAIVLTAGDVSGLGSLASQSAAAVAISGGSVSGANVSGALSTAALPNAVPRSHAIRATDIVNINDFGLARDGITDDSAKFVAATQLAIAKRGKLYIPAGGPILLTDAAQQNLQNVCIYGDGGRDVDASPGYGHTNSALWFTGTTRTPFLLGNAVTFEGLNFFYPNQTEAATLNNGNLPTVYPPLLGQQTPNTNITGFNFVNCQVTNCYDFLTVTGTVTAFGNCTLDRCVIYAIRNCFTLQNVPEVFFIGDSLFTWGIYGSVVSVGPTYNLRNFTNTQATWLKIVGDGTPSRGASTVVGGIMSSSVYVFGMSRGIWLAGGTIDVSTFVNTSFDNVPTVIQGDPGCSIQTTRFVGGTWYPIYFSQAGNPDTTAIVINTPAPVGIGLNVSFTAITVPFIAGSLASITGAYISALSFTDMRCNSFGHTQGGVGPYYGLQLNTPNANVRISACDFAPANSGLANTAIQLSGINTALISDCNFRFLTVPIDVQTGGGIITLSANSSIGTTGPASIGGIGTNNVRDLFNSWDKSSTVYNGYVPTLYRPGASIGLQPVASSAVTGYVGLQPSASGSGGGTRLGLTAAGSGAVSLLTNSFGEEQFRAVRVAGVANFVAVRGSASGAPALINTNGADVNGSIQLSGSGAGITYLGSLGSGGSRLSHQGVVADASYIGVTPVNGFSITVPSNCGTVLLRPLGVLATGSINLPAAVLDGERISIWTAKAISALTVNGQPGTTVNGGVNMALNSNSTATFMWNSPNATWFLALGNSGSSSGSLSQQNADNVAITGGSITNLTALSAGGAAATSASLLLNSAAGFGRQVVYETAGVPRWVVGAQGTAETNLSQTAAAAVANGATNVALTATTGIVSGMLMGAPGVAAGTTVSSVNGDGSVTLSLPLIGPIAAGASISFYTNLGSDFGILAYDDNGASLAPTNGQSLLISRATGLVSMRTLSVVSSATAPTIAAGDNSNQVATTAFVHTAVASSYSPSSVAITGGSIDGTVIGGSTPAAASVMSLAVGGTSVPSANVSYNSAANGTRTASYLTAGVNRWALGLEADAENTLRLSTIADAPAGATSLAFPSTTGIVIGMFVSVAGLPRGTSVSAISSTSVTLSAAATADVPPGTLVLFYSNAGASFGLIGYDDTGVQLPGQAFVVSRATGQMVIRNLQAMAATVPTQSQADNSTNAASTAFVAAAIAPVRVLAIAAVPSSQLGVANGVATLDGSGKLSAAQIPATPMGALSYQGGWNAATNIPALASGSGTKGNYYTVAIAGGTTLEGISQWNVGDHAAFTGIAWEKFDGLSSEVVSVAGRTGAVVLNAADIAGLAPLATVSGTGYAYANGGSGPGFSATIPYAALSSAPPLGSIAPQNASAVSISGGAINGTPIGGITIAAGAFTTLSATLAATVPTVAIADNSTNAASTAYVQAQGYAFATALGTIAGQNKTAIAITGGTISGLTALSLGANAGGAVAASINAAAGLGRQLVYQSAGVSRWSALATGDVETAPLVLTTNATTTSSPVLNFASTTGVVVGQSVSGTGIIAGSLVTAATATTATISTTATVASGAPISFYANAGSLFAIRAYDDGGSLLFTPISLGRASSAALTLGTLNYGPVVLQGGAVAGSVRGLGAFDAQQYRTAGGQIASGLGSAVFGQNNTASGASSFVAGLSNVASGTASVAFGNSNSATGTASHCFGLQARDSGRFGISALASGFNAIQGDAQRSEQVLRAITTGSVARMTTDGAVAGAANTVNLPNNACFKINVEIVGFNATGGVAGSWFARDILVLRGASASATSLSSGTLSVGGSIGSITGWTAPSLAADTSNGGISLSAGFTAAATIKWVGRVVAVEAM